MTHKTGPITAADQAEVLNVMATDREYIAADVATLIGDITAIRVARIFNLLAKDGRVECIRRDNAYGNVWVKMIAQTKAQADIIAEDAACKALLASASRNRYKDIPGLHQWGAYPR